MMGDERYRFVGNKIGDGGQGAVYLAEDIMFGRHVAVKVLNCESLDEITFLRQLLVDEAKLQFKLSNNEQRHPNIVFVMDVRTIDGEPAIVMEYVDGKSLYDLMGPKNQRHPLSQEQFFDITLQICEGLAFAHSKGVIHRDMKPRNVLLANDGVVKIIDWGVAKNIDIAGRGRTYAGTPPYMSPEVVLLNRRDVAERLTGAGVDHRTDIYSLGVTVYEMLTTNLPFINPVSREDDILKGVTEEHRRGLLNMGVDAAVVDMILKAMARDPDKRYQTATEFKNDLLAFRQSGKAVTVYARPDFRPMESDPRKIVTEYTPSSVTTGTAATGYGNPSIGSNTPSVGSNTPSVGSGSPSTSGRSTDSRRTTITISRKTGSGIAVGAGVCLAIAGTIFLVNRGSTQNLIPRTVPSAAPSVAAVSTPAPATPAPTKKVEHKKETPPKPKVDDTEKRKAREEERRREEERKDLERQKKELEKQKRELEQRSHAPKVEREKPAPAPHVEKPKPTPAPPKPKPAPAESHPSKPSHNIDHNKDVDELLKDG